MYKPGPGSPGNVNCVLDVQMYTSEARTEVSKVTYRLSALIASDQYGYCLGITKAGKGAVPKGLRDKVYYVDQTDLLEYPKFGNIQYTELNLRPIPADDLFKLGFAASLSEAETMFGKIEKYECFPSLGTLTWF
jgi:hypothetical protein